MEPNSIVINDLDCLMKAVEFANKKFGGQVWWRGQGDSGWQLTASVFREFNRGGDTYEVNIVDRFVRNAPSRQSNLPTNNAYLDWLFLMQHHGLHTRLLDWTESPLFACFFAVEGEKEKGSDGALFALSPYIFNKYQIGIDKIVSPDEEIAINISKKAFGTFPENSEQIICIVPNKNNIRIAVQLSVFTLHDSKNPLEFIPNIDSMLIKFLIPSDNKSYLEGRLKYLGIRKSELFPDLDHLAIELNNLAFSLPPK